MYSFLFSIAAATDTGETGILPILILYGAIFAVFWFFLIRPQRKKQKQVEQMQNSITIGDSVLTSGGLYGKVIDKVNDVYMVEFGTNKSVRVPVQKSAIVAISEPDLSVVKEVVEEEEKDKDKK